MYTCMLKINKNQYAFLHDFQPTLEKFILTPLLFLFDAMIFKLYDMKCYYRVRTYY